jgi:hypothetical protein
MGNNRNKQKIDVISTFHLVDKDESIGNHEKLCVKSEDYEELHLENNHENLHAKSKGGHMLIHGEDEWAHEQEAHKQQRKIYAQK